MVHANLDEFWQAIAGFFPEYGADGGNDTRVLFKDGREMVDPRKTATFLKALAGVFALDLGALRKKYGRVLGKTTAVPLPLHLELILVPVRVRQVLSKDHGATGYFVLSRLQKFAGEAENGAITRIDLEGGAHFCCLESAPTVRKRVIEARAVKDEYRNLHTGYAPAGLVGRSAEALAGGGAPVVYHFHCSAEEIAERLAESTARLGRE